MERPEAVIERAREALSFSIESANREFKSGQPFDTLKFHIIRTALGMANTRDGGLIIIGVRETPALEAEGVTDNDLESYDAEKVHRAINSYATPAIEVQTLRFEHHDKKFIVIAISEFTRTPILCRKPIPDPPGKEELRKGDVLVRTSGNIGTERVTTAEMMSEILQRASYRIALETLRGLQDAGVTLSIASSEPRREAELADIREFF